MDHFRNRWYLIGFCLAVCGIIFLIVWHKYLSDLRVLLTISLITLLLHQFEEYHFPGYFPRMLNTTLFKSKLPDRFPLNSNTAWIINVWIGWLLYAVTIIFADKAMWLATATIVVSAGNVLAHALLFNLKGKTIYNPGMVTALVLFLPVVTYYFIFISQHHLLHLNDLLFGIAIGLVINYFGVLKLITLFGNKKTHYVFKPFH